MSCALTKCLPAILMTALLLPQAAAADQVVCTQFETAGIDGRKWDMRNPGAMTVDAAHRQVLLRFPGAAQQIADAVAKGKRVAKVELVFQFDSLQLRGTGYDVQYRETWKKNPPNWHILAQVLRRPWVADEKIGPTFNAYIHGAGYTLSRRVSAGRRPTMRKAVWTSPTS